MPRKKTEPLPFGGQEPQAVLREIRAKLSTVFHDANNPLAIISGNAQYLVEVGAMMNLDEEVMQPIRDIEEASRRVADKLRDLARLKEEIAQYMASHAAAGEQTEPK